VSRRPIRFETADTDAHTAIGEGLTRLARDAGRLVVGGEVGKYALRHDDGCAVCDRPVRAGDAFFLDPPTGAVLCEAHGRARRAAAEGETTDGSTDPEPTGGAAGTSGSSAPDGANGTGPPSGGDR
jgi:hypothetical protein